MLTQLSGGKLCQIVHLFFERTLCCGGVAPHRRNFYWMMTFVCISMMMWITALWTAWHFGMTFPGYLHMMPFLFLMVAHCTFSGMSHDEDSPLYRDNPAECDKTMVRVGFACVLCAAALLAAFYVNMTLWWHNEPEFTAKVPIGGASPTLEPSEDTTFSATPSKRPKDNNPIPVWLRTPTATPTRSATPYPTPSASPDPVKIARRQEVLNNAESSIGYWFMCSVICGVITVYFHHAYKTCERGPGF